MITGLCVENNCKVLAVNSTASGAHSLTLKCLRPRLPNRQACWENGMKSDKNSQGHFILQILKMDLVLRTSSPPCAWQVCEDGAGPPSASHCSWNLLPIIAYCAHYKVLRVFKFQVTGVLITT